MKSISFPVLTPAQSDQTQVACFTATADKISLIARLERLGRNEAGVPSGFQRPQIAGHIREIGDYLQKSDAILANPIVIGFVEGAKIRRSKDGLRLSVDVAQGPPGWIVDGQQRFSALLEVGRPGFEVLVSAFICATEEELRKQFILINNTRQLPKGLINELLPRVSGLPHRLGSRSRAAALVEVLNYRDGSALKGLIQGHTNPQGVIRDTHVQKLLMHSLSDGALRLYQDDDEMLQSKGMDLVSEFFHAVRHVYRDEWDQHTPRTSRLLHGAGILAMGFVMEYLHAATGATKRGQFLGPLTLLRPHTSWTEGQWDFGSEVRRWNSLQCVSADWKLLAFYLTRKSQQIVVADQRAGEHVRG